jgi:hypothetical protein
MYNSLAAIAAAAALSTGYSPVSGGRSHRRPSRVFEPTIEDVERLWVTGALQKQRRKQRAMVTIIMLFARAHGPWAHRFGYGALPQIREITRRLRQQARIEAKKGKQYVC